MTTVEGTILDAITTKRLGSTFQLVFTDRRMIAARTGVSWALMSGFGAVGAAAAMASTKRGMDSMQGLSPQMILESHRKNWEVPYMDISKVRLKKAWTCCALTMTHTDGRKEYFEFPKPQYDHAKALLSMLFPYSLETKP